MLLYLLAFVILASGSVYFYRKYQMAARIQKAEVIAQTIGKMFQEDAQKVVDEVKSK